MPLDRLFVTIAALLGATGVAAGAFAAHGLKPHLSERLLTIFETAVRYQMIHALALLAVAVLMGQGTATGPWWGVAGWSLVIGVGIFSGSLYILSLTGLNILGAITPLGGVALIVGWLSLALAALTGAGSSTPG